MADAPTVHRNPITYFPLETVEAFSESELTARREAEMVSKITELSIKGENFWELRKKEKTALKANCVAQSSEYVETGRYKRPYEYIKLSPVKSKPKAE